MPVTAPSVTATRKRSTLPFGPRSELRVLRSKAPGSRLRGLRPRPELMPKSKSKPQPSQAQTQTSSLQEPWFRADRRIAKRPNSKTRGTRSFHHRARGYTGADMRPWADTGATMHSSARAARSIAARAQRSTACVHVRRYRSAKGNGPLEHRASRSTASAEGLTPVAVARPAIRRRAASRRPNSVQPDAQSRAT